MNTLPKSFLKKVKGGWGEWKKQFFKNVFSAPPMHSCHCLAEKQIPLLGAQEVVKEEIRDEKTPDLMRKQLFFGYFSS